MTVSAAIVHRLPGRIRLRLSEKRGDMDYFSALSENFLHLNGVQKVKSNASTGSLVIEFSDTLENLIQQLQQQDVAVHHESNANAKSMRLPPVNIAPLHLVSNRQINAMFMMGTLLAAVGVVQIIRGKILVPSLSMFWYAMDAFHRSQKHSVAMND